MFDYIGIDWGEKICGIAFGDSTSRLIIASTKETRTQDIFDTILAEATKRSTAYIVVGSPLTFHGKDTRVTFLIKQFIEKLQLLLPNCDIFTIGERGTTKDSFEKIGKSLKYQIDNQSAAEILDRYFQKYLPQI
jgi:RNase H-fold protein (predicted Holliday junction resolvase)